MHAPLISMSAQVLSPDTRRAGGYEQGIVLGRSGENLYDIRLPSGTVTVELAPTEMLPDQARVQVQIQGTQVEIRLLGPQGPGGETTAAIIPTTIDLSPQGEVSQLKDLAVALLQRLPTPGSESPGQLPAQIAELAARLEPALRDPILALAKMSTPKDQSTNNTQAPAGTPSTDTLQKMLQLIDIAPPASNDQSQTARTELRTFIQHALNFSDQAADQNAAAQIARRLQGALGRIPPGLENAASRLSEAVRLHLSEPGDTRMQTNLVRELTLFVATLDKSSAASSNPVSVLLPRPVQEGFMHFGTQQEFRSWFSHVLPETPFAAGNTIGVSGGLTVRTSVSASGTGLLTLVPGAAAAAEIALFSHSTLQTPQVREVFERLAPQALVAHGALDTVAIETIDSFLATVPPASRESAAELMVRAALLPPADQSSAAPRSYAAELAPLLSALQQAIGESPVADDSFVNRPLLATVQGGTATDPLTAFNLPKLFESLGMDFEKLSGAGAPPVETLKGQLLGLLARLEQPQTTPVLLPQNAEPVSAPIVARFAELIAAPLHASRPESPVAANVQQALNATFESLNKQLPALAGAVSSRADLEFAVKNLVRTALTELIHTIDTLAEQKNFNEKPDGSATRDQQLRQSVVHRLESALPLLERRLVDALVTGRADQLREGAAESLHSQASNLLTRLETLQLGARPLLLPDGQQQTLTLPVKMGTQWEQLPVTLIHRKATGKQGSNKRSRYTVALSTSAGYAGPTGVTMDYQVGSALRLSLTFQNSATRTWFEKHRREFETAVQGVGFAVVTTHFASRSAAQPDTAKHPASQGSNQLRESTGQSQTKLDVRA